MIDVTLANLTLQKIGADDQLADPAEDSHNAATLRVSWDHVRKLCLRELTPTFAKRRAALPKRTSGAAPIGFATAYPVPSGFLRLLEILDPAMSTRDYRLIGDDASAGGFEILANCTGLLSIEFVKDITSVARWDPLFAESFADRLGLQVADRITCDLDRLELCRARYKVAKAQAGGADSKEQPPTVPEESDWVTARCGWWDGPPYA